MHAIIDADRTESLIIQFSNSFTSSLFDFQRIMHLYHDLHVLCIYTHPELVGELRIIANKMRDIFLAGERDRESKCCMLLLEFMIKLDENRDILLPDMHREKSEASEQGESTIQKMIAVTEFVKSHLADEDLSLNTMAGMAGITPEHFSRSFKSMTGQTYIKWLNMIKIEKAISLFASSGMSLTEIAMLSGFQSISSFNRVFKESKSMSPSEYRGLYSK